jgi:hypothetical protein
VTFVSVVSVAAFRAAAAGRRGAGASVAKRGELPYGAAPYPVPSLMSVWNPAK